MPTVENVPGGLACPYVSRFTFERTQGPSLGAKKIGPWYTIASNFVTLDATDNLGLGVGGYLNSDPPRSFNNQWQGLARSTPAPLLLGTTSEYELRIEGLFYMHNKLEMIENFLRDAPNQIGPWGGTLKQYKQDGTTLFKTFALCFFMGMQYSYDGSDSFVEYSVTFGTASEPT